MFRYIPLVAFAAIFACAGCAGPQPAETPSEETRETSSAKTHYRFRYLLQANEALAARFERLAEEMRVQIDKKWPEAGGGVEHPAGGFNLRVPFDTPPPPDEFRDLLEERFPSLDPPAQVAGSFEVGMSERMLEMHREAVVEQTLASLRTRLFSAGLQRDQFDVKIRENYTVDVVVPRLDGERLQRLDARLREPAGFALRHVDDANNVAFFRYLELPDGFELGEGGGGHLTVTHRDKQALAKFFEGKVPDDHVVGFEKHTETNERGATETYWRTYYMWRDPVVSHEHILSARAAIDETFNRPYVAINLSEQGGRLFGDFTEEHVGHRVAITVGERVYSAPVINEPIPGGRLQVSLGRLRSFEELASEARRLTLVIRHAMIGTRLEKLSEGPVGRASQ